MRAREVAASPQRGTPVANCCHAELLACALTTTGRDWSSCHIFATHGRVSMRLEVRQGVEVPGQATGQLGEPHGSDEAAELNWEHQRLGA